MGFAVLRVAAKFATLHLEGRFYTKSARRNYKDAVNLKRKLEAKDRAAKRRKPARRDRRKPD